MCADVPATTGRERTVHDSWHVSRSQRTAAGVDTGHYTTTSGPDRYPLHRWMYDTPRSTTQICATSSFYRSMLRWLTVWHSDNCICRMKNYPLLSPVSTGMGDRLPAGTPPWYVTNPVRPTQPCIHPGSLNQAPALIGQSKGRNVISVGWQVTLCNPTWHVSSCSGEACSQTAISSYLLHAVVMCPSIRYRSVFY